MEKEISLRFYRIGAEFGEYRQPTEIILNKTGTNWSTRYINKQGRGEQVMDANKEIELFDQVTKEHRKSGLDAVLREFKQERAKFPAGTTATIHSPLFGRNGQLLKAA